MMNVQFDRLTDGGGQRLLVFLPGAYMQPKDFIAAGLVAAVRGSALPWDIALCGYNVAEIATGAALDHLHAEVVDPSPVPVTLCGISLGGLLATTHAARWPHSRADALCLLAPYPGPYPVTSGVLAADRLAAWQPGAIADDDVDRRAWRWWQQEAARTRTFLAWGADDRFAASHRRMAEALPPGSACEQHGGHDWPTWTALFAAWLAQEVAHA